VLVIIQFFLFSADKMLCILVSAMLVLPKTWGYGTLPPTLV
jgi:hypothetical protein